MKLNPDLLPNFTIKEITSSIDIEKILYNPKKELEKKSKILDSKPISKNSNSLEKFITSLKNGVPLTELQKQKNFHFLIFSTYNKYIDDQESKSWLPYFDKNVIDIIFENTKKITNNKLGQWSQFFLIYFNKIKRDSLDYLSKKLNDLYSRNSSDKPLNKSSKKLKAWNKNYQLIFSINGPTKIAETLEKNQRISNLISKFDIPQESDYAKAIRSSAIIYKVKNCPLDQGIEDIEKAIENKETFYDNTKRIGAKTLEVLIERSKKENNGSLPKKWASYLIKLGCDPRMPRSSIEFDHWWSWASDEQLRIAISAITEKTLGAFIKFLEESLSGTKYEDQFYKRRDFILALFNTNKILDVRLVMSPQFYDDIDNNLRDPHTVSILTNKNKKEFSVICCQCVDNITIVEGTENFGLKVFSKNKPYFIDKLWQPSKENGLFSLSDGVMPKEFKDSIFRKVSQEMENNGIDSGYITHKANGKWGDRFFDYIRNNYQISWEDARDQYNQS